MHRRLLSAALFGLFAAIGSGAAQAQSNDPSFRIVNNTQAVVNEVYASPSSQNTWGQDRLGSEVIAPGASHIVRLPAGECVYDVRVVYQSGQAEERRNVNTCNLVNFVLGGGAAPGPAQGQAPAQGQGQAQGRGQANPSFNLVNQGSRTIEQFYASPSSQQNWGPDRLGDATVSPGSRFAVRLPAGECVYDMRVVFAGGEAQERRRVNACEMVDYVVR